MKSQCQRASSDFHSSANSMGHDIGFHKHKCKNRRKRKRVGCRMKVRDLVNGVVSIHKTFVPFAAVLVTISGDQMNDTE